MKKLQTKSPYRVMLNYIWRFGVFARCTHSENKKTHTSQCEPKQTALVTSAGLEPATF